MNHIIQINPRFSLTLKNLYVDVHYSLMHKIKSLETSYKLFIVCGKDKTKLCCCQQEISTREYEYTKFTNRIS